MAYRTVNETFWISPSVKKLKKAEKYVYLYLITNPHSHYSGLYYLPSSRVIQSESGMKETEFMSSMKKLIDEKAVMFDLESGLVWIVKMLKNLNGGKDLNSKQIKGLRTHIDKLPDFSIIRKFSQFYHLDTSMDRAIDTPMDTPIDRTSDRSIDRSTDERKQKQKQITDVKSTTKVKRQEQSNVNSTSIKNDTVVRLSSFLKGKEERVVSDQWKLTVEIYDSGILRYTKLFIYSAMLQSKGRKNPVGYLIKLLSLGDYVPTDEALRNATISLRDQEIFV